MQGVALGFYGQSPRLSDHLGIRVADWLKARNLKAAALALATGLDKRDAQRVIDGSCGTRAFDRLSTTYGWDFIEAVMTPIVGDDPVSAREKEVAQRIAEASAIHERVARDRAARAAVAEARRGRSISSGEGDPSAARHHGKGLALGKRPAERLSFLRDE